MKFFRIDLLTLLISLFLLNSCKNENTLGLAVDPSQQITGTLIDSSTVVTQTIAEDTVATTDLAATPLAYFKDPVIGTSEANIATSVNPPTSYTAPTGTVTIDSALVVLRYASNFYGDSLTSKYKVNVFQLAERPSLTTVYYNNKTWNYTSSKVLGSLTFNARPNTPFKIYDIVTGKADTQKVVPAQIRVKIDPAFIQQYLFNQSSTVTASGNLFQSAIKGLYMTLDKNQAGSGGRMFFQLDSSRIDVYYRNDSGSSVDTTMISLPFVNHAAEIKHNFSAQVNTALNNSGSGTASQETIYMDGLAGLRTKVMFPYLKNIIAKAGSDIVLNRAELVISALPGTDIPFPPQPKITMYRWDIAHQRTLLPDATGGSSTGVTDTRFISADVFGGYYDATLREYHFIITGYISDLMRGKTADYGTFIAPIDAVTSTTVNIAASSQASGRVVVGGGVTNKSSANYPYRMKLNIIYTKATR